MEHRLESGLTADHTSVSPRFGDSHTAGSSPLRLPDPPWLATLEEARQEPGAAPVWPENNGRELLDESSEQQHGQDGSGLAASERAPAEPSAHDTAPRDQHGRIQEVPLSQITLSHAYRRIVMDVGSLRDLMSSIDAVDLQRPLLVRPVDGGQYELVIGDRRLTALHQLGHETALVEIREMTDRKAAEAAFLDDLHHRRRRFWERALQLEVIRACIAAEHGVPASAVRNRDILSSLGIRSGQRSMDSRVSECLRALDLLTPDVLAFAEVERYDPRLATAVTRPVYRRIRDAPDDRVRAAIVYEAVHGHPPAWAPPNVGFDVASVVSTKQTQHTVAVEVAWDRVPPGHITAVRKYARAELDRLLRKPPVRSSLPVPAPRTGAPLPQPEDTVAPERRSRTPESI